MLQVFARLHRAVCLVTKQLSQDSFESESIPSLKAGKAGTFCLPENQTESGHFDPTAAAAQTRAEHSEGLGEPERKVKAQHFAGGEQGSLRGLCVDSQISSSPMSAIVAFPTGNILYSSGQKPESGCGRDLPATSATDSNFETVGEGGCEENKYKKLACMIKGASDGGKTFTETIEELRIQLAAALERAKTAEMRFERLKQTVQAAVGVEPE